MTCRDEVLAAFEALTRLTDAIDFTPAEVLAQVRLAGSSYAPSTIRTHVCSHMVEDGSLLRSGPARYRLQRHADRPTPTPSPAVASTATMISEDDVKKAVADMLTADGWTVDVRWGRDRGIDIDAHRGTERLIIEAKGQVTNPPQQVSYFLGALGELVQRMNDPNARYALALPDHPQYRGLVNRLPSLARTRLNLEVFLVDTKGAVTTG